MKGIHTTILLLSILVSACAKDEEGESRLLSPKDMLAITTQETAKYIVKDVEIGEQQIDKGQYDARIDRIKKYGADEALKIERKENKIIIEQSRQNLLIQSQGQKMVNNQLENQTTHEIVAFKDTKIPRANRSLKECLKPGNIIDNEVIGCTRWEVEKNW